MSKLGYDKEGVLRALDHHKRGHMFRSVRGVGLDLPEVNHWTRLEVELNLGDVVELRTLREAYVFVMGIASARLRLEPCCDRESHQEAYKRKAYEREARLREQGQQRMNDMNYPGSS